jgi:hypothetical protein
MATKQTKKKTPSKKTEPKPSRTSTRQPAKKPSRGARAAAQPTPAPNPAASDAAATAERNTTLSETRSDVGAATSVPIAEATSMPGAAGPEKASKARKRAGAPNATLPSSGAAPAAGPRDGRVPPPGTVIRKLNRHGIVRCECLVEEGGIRYKGSLYSSLSGAAMAAAKDLGLENKTQNGFIFWGLTKPGRAGVDPLTVLNRAWERYHGGAAVLINTTAS